MLDFRFAGILYNDVTIRIQADTKVAYISCDELTAGPLPNMVHMYRELKEDGIHGGWSGFILQPDLMKIRYG